MFLVLVMALGMLPATASAASSTIGGALGEVNITNGGYKQSYLSMNGSVRSQYYTYFNFKSASGAIKEIPAYCINPATKGVPQSVSPGTSIKYIANEASNDPKIVGIIANGYPHRGLSELKLDNKYQAYYATKMALWCYLIDGWSIDRLTVNPSLSGVERARRETSRCGQGYLQARYLVEPRSPAYHHRNGGQGLRLSRHRKRQGILAAGVHGGFGNMGVRLRHRHRFHHAQ